MNILFIGDIFGKPGRRAVTNELSRLKKENNIDLVIANAENTTHGRSLSIQHYNLLRQAGVDYFTFGNHTWDSDEIYDVLKTPYAIRPLNLKKDTEQAKHGVGSLTINIKNKNICITNLLGNTIQMHGLQDNPFPLFKDFLKTVKADIHIVDLHTETTSEKNAFLLTFAKQVSAIIGTHTHVQTADEKIYKNTAYITDAGMTGPAYGIIGAKPDSLLDMFMGKSERFRLEPENGIYQFNGVVLSFDDKTNIVKNITRINFLETK